MSSPNEGSNNDGPEDIIRKHLSPGLNSWADGWAALIAALAAGDQVNVTNATLAFDQLFKSTASGKYLDRRCADDGLMRPENVGIGDEAFRKLAIKTTKKIVTQALLEALEAYYSTSSTRAHLAATAVASYAIQADWTLLVSIDGDTPISIPFVSADFATPGSGSAAEVAAVITRWLKRNGSNAYALAESDPSTGIFVPVIYSGALGLKSSVQIVGGRAQNVLNFPNEVVDVGIADSTWAITKPVPGVARYTIIAAAATDLSGVQPGDYVNVFGTAFSSFNQGTFTIEKVDIRYSGANLVQWFEVSNFAAVAESGKVIGTSSDMVFFRPERATINNNGSRAVVVSQTKANSIDIQLPATTTAVTRTIKTGAYGSTVAPLAINTATRGPDGNLSITTTLSHGLTTGNQVFVEGLFQSGDSPSTINGNGTSTTDASLITILSTLADMPGVACWECEGVRLADGRGFIAGGKTNTGVSIADSQIFAITGSTTLTNGEIRYDYTWTATTSLPTAVYGHRMTVLTSPIQIDNILVSGGINAGGIPINKARVYNVALGTWSAELTMVETRSSHAQVALDDGTVLVVGGQSSVPMVSLAEIFSPSALGGTFAPTVGNMSMVRFDAAAIKLSSGKVLVIGGETDTAFTETCELYDPTTGTFSMAAPMAYVRHGHSATLIGDDLILVVGGEGRKVNSSGADTTLDTAEIYDGKTGRWYPAGRLNVVGDYYGHATSLIQNSELVALTGSTVIRRYDLGTKTWASSRAVLDGTRLGSAVIRIGDGLLLVAGGSNNNGATVLKSAKLLVPASNTISSGALSGTFRVSSAPTATKFIVNTAALSYTSAYVTDATATPFRQVVATNIPGPYLWDSTGGVSITATQTTLTTAIFAGSKHKVLYVSSTAAFPDSEGWLVLGLATTRELRFARYLGNSGPTTLLFDYAQEFSQDLPIGTTVTLLANRGSFIPVSPESLGSFYITDSSSGRIAAGNSIRDLTAAGIAISETVIYPGDRGLGGEGLPVSGAQKLSDRVAIWASNDIDGEVEAARDDTDA